jgi:HlyD family secretion protein
MGGSSSPHCERYARGVARRVQYPRPSHPMKRVVILVLVLVIGLSVALTYRLRQLNAYKTAPAGGTGTVEGTEVNVTARIPARIVAVHVSEGEAVTAGQLLVELECAEPEAALLQAQAQMATAQANVQAALAQVRAAGGGATVARRGVLAAAAEALAAASDQSTAAKEAARLRSLHDGGVVSSSELDRMESTQVAASQRVEIVKANREAAAAQVGVAYQTERAALAQAEAAKTAVEAASAAVARAATTVKECKLYAPRAAVVQTRSYEPGEVVLPGANLLTLVDLSEVRVTFYLPNAELAAAAPGKKVGVWADAYPGQRFEGAIRHVSAKAEFTPKNVQTREDRDRLVYGVEIRIPNRDGRLRPGMPVEVFIDGTGR